jgi:Fe-S-cluster-containing dehydrogenase component
MEDNSRRTFLKLAGATILTGVGAPVVKALANEPAVDQGGSRMAMVVNLKQCMRQQGCTDCLTACHHAHNVPMLSNPEFKLTPQEVQMREIKWIWKETFKRTFPTEETPYMREDLAQLAEKNENNILVLCNHCDNPPCVRVCPTQATWKRKSDGLVMMDMHRCIGCRYCVVACPYGSRSFNWRDPRQFLDEKQLNPNYPTRSKGVVEKCNFCEERIVDGLQPACVTACKYRALTFGDLKDPNSDVRRVLRTQFTIRRKPGLGTNPQVYYVV